MCVKSSIRIFIVRTGILLSALVFFYAHQSITVFASTQIFISTLQSSGSAYMCNGIGDPWDSPFMNNAYAFANSGDIPVAQVNTFNTSMSNFFATGGGGPENYRIQSGSTENLDWTFEMWQGNGADLVHCRGSVTVTKKMNSCPDYQWQPTSWGTECISDSSASYSNQDPRCNPTNGDGAGEKCTPGATPIRMLSV